MVVSRSPRMQVGHFNYERLIESVDWNRVVIQAMAEHAKNHYDRGYPVCGECIKSVLLRTDE